MDVKYDSEKEGSNEIHIKTEDEMLEQSQSRLANLAMEEKKTAIIAEILSKREKGMEMRKKGRLVKLRIRTQMTKRERDETSRSRIHKKLTQEVAEQISNEWLNNERISYESISIEWISNEQINENQQN